METLIEFSFEDWRKSQFADLAIEIVDSERSTNVGLKFLPIKKAILRKFVDKSGAVEELSLLADDDGALWEFVVLHFIDSGEMQYCNCDTNDEFSLFIKVR